MTLTFYNNSSEVNKIGKALTELTSLEGTLRQGTSILNPVVRINRALSVEEMKSNYLYIPEFERYYFITNIESVRNNIWDISASVDVLETYKLQILENTCVIARQENLWNMYLNDGQFKVYQNPNIVTKTFPSGFSTQSFVLAVSGG